MTPGRNIVLFLSLAFGSQAYAETVAAQAVTILESRCGSCHGDKSAMSGFRISSRDAILKGGSRGAAVQPGHSSDSLLYKAVTHSGPLTMPPGPKLGNEEIAVLREWIETGAPWPEHTAGVKK